MQIPVGSRCTIKEGVCPIWTFVTSWAYVTRDTIKGHGCGSPADTVPPRTANSIRCRQTFSCTWSPRIAWNTLLHSLKTGCVTVCSIRTGKFMWSFCAYWTIVTRQANTSICNVWKGAIVLKKKINFFKMWLNSNDHYKSPGLQTVHQTILQHSFVRSAMVLYQKTTAPYLSVNILVCT